MNHLGPGARPPAAAKAPASPRGGLCERLASGFPWALPAPSNRAVFLATSLCLHSSSLKWPLPHRAKSYWPGPPSISSYETHKRNLCPLFLLSYQMALPARVPRTSPPHLLLSDFQTSFFSSLYFKPLSIDINPSYLPCSSQSQRPVGPAAEQPWSLQCVTPSRHHLASG